MTNSMRGTVRGNGVCMFYEIGGGSVREIGAEEIGTGGITAGIVGASEFKELEKGLGLSEAVIV